MLEQIGQEARFPTRLAEQFPRIVDKIADMWGQDELESYFEELLIMDRADRQGFPPEIGAELMLLSMAYDLSRHKPDEEEDVWSNERIQAQDELERLGLKATVRDFHHSISANLPQAVELYLRAGMTLESADDQGWTPVLRLSFEGNHVMLLNMVRRGARVDVADRDGYGPLHWAALNGHDQAVKILIEHHAAVNLSSRQGFTPLIQAASGGHTGVVQRLLNAGAYVNQATLDGWSALHKAIANGHVETAIRLLDLGADPLARYVDGTTPLQMAQERNMRRLCDVIQLTLSLRQRLESAAATRYTP